MKIQLKRPPRSREGGPAREIELLEDGKYPATIDKIEQVDDEYGGLMVFLTFHGDVPEPKDRRFRVFDASEAAKSLVDLAGGDAEAAEADFDPETVVGTDAYVYLGNRQSKKDKKYYNTLKRFAVMRRK